KHRHLQSARLIQPPAKGRRRKGVGLIRFLGPNQKAALAVRRFAFQSYRRQSGLVAHNVRGTSQLRGSRRIKDFGTTSLAVRQGSTSWLIRRSHAMLASMYASCQGRSAPRESSWTPSWVASFAASSRVGALANAIHESDVSTSGRFIRSPRRTSTYARMVPAIPISAKDTVHRQHLLETPLGHTDIPTPDANDRPRTSSDHPDGSGGAIHLVHVQLIKRVLLRPNLTPTRILTHELDGLSRSDRCDRSQIGSEGVRDAGMERNSSHRSRPIR